MNTSNTTYEIVHAYVYDVSSPSLFKRKANERSRCTVIRCSNKDECTFFKRGECIMLGVQLFNSTRCPYGKKEVETGFTRRAQKNWKWCDSREKKYKEWHGALKQPTDVLARVGDLVYVPYSHMNMNEKLPFETHSSAFITGDKFLPWDIFKKPETIMEIVTFIPYAMMGGAIKSYQRDEVPMFVKHLQENFPDVYDEANINGSLDKVIEVFSNIGRQAYIHTLKKGCTVWKKTCPNESWVWDGKVLKSTKQSYLFPITEFEQLESILTPKKDAVITITSDDQVDENTKYLK